MEYFTETWAALAIAPKRRGGSAPSDRGTMRKQLAELARRLDCARALGTTAATSALPSARAPSMRAPED